MEGGVVRLQRRKPSCTPSNGSGDQDGTKGGVQEVGKGRLDSKSVSK